MVLPGAKGLDVERVDVLDPLAGDAVALAAVDVEQVEEVVPVLVEAGPEDEDLGLLDGAGAGVVDGVDVGDLLAQLLLELVLVGDLLRDVVLHLRRLRRPRHAPVRLHRHRDTDQALVVLKRAKRVGGV